ncbi:MAG: polysaccharide deacetylase, partial [Acidobacteriaceae bacterium]|nr:polysaccharide deacetylase [Acidobacteriaceae bacterium]
AAPDGGYVMEPLAVDQAANQSLSKYALVVLSDVGSLPFGFENTLRTYVNGGGSLLVVLGPSSVNLRKVPLLDAPIHGSRLASREAERYQSVSASDPEHPIIRRANKLDGIQIYQAVQTDPGSARVIARLANQTPLLYEQQVGEGRVVVFASTFDNISNDFPLHLSFLPFVEETAKYLGGQQDRSTNVGVDSFIDLRSAKEHGASVEVIDPHGQRPLSLKEAATAQNFQVVREGFYDIHRANGRQELVAVHADRRESDLTVMPQDTMNLWKATGNSEPAPVNVTGVQELSQPHSLWRYALLVVLLLAVSESIFASRYLSVEKDLA